MTKLLLDPTAEGGSAASVSPGEAGAGAAASSSTTTHDVELARALSYLPEPDLHVPVVDPLFDLPTAKKFKIRRPELKLPDNDPTDKGVSARISFDALEELTSDKKTGEIKFAPGYVFRPRPFELVSDSGKVEQRNHFAQRDLNRLLIAAGLAKKGATLSAKEIVTALLTGGLEGREIYIKLSTNTSSKRDASGEFFRTRTHLAETLRASGVYAARAHPRSPPGHRDGSFLWQPLATRRRASNFCECGRIRYLHPPQVDRTVILSSPGCVFLPPRIHKS